MVLEEKLCIVIVAGRKSPVCLMLFSDNYLITPLSSHWELRSIPSSIHLLPRSSPLTSFVVDTVVNSPWAPILPSPPPPPSILFPFPSPFPLSNYPPTYPINYLQQNQSPREPYHSSPKRAAFDCPKRKEPKRREKAKTWTLKSGIIYSYSGGNLTRARCLLCFSLAS